MGNRKDRQSRLACGRVKKLCDIEGITLPPARKRWCRQQVVDCHYEGKSILGGIKCFQIEHSDLGKRRVLNAFNQRWQVEGATVLPLVRNKCREKDVLTTLQGIGIKPEQTKKAARRRLRALGPRLYIV